MSAKWVGAERPRAITLGLFLRFSLFSLYRLCGILYRVVDAEVLSLITRPPFTSFSTSFYFLSLLMKIDTDRKFAIKKN